MHIEVTRNYPTQSLDLASLRCACGRLWECVEPHTEGYGPPAALAKNIESMRAAGGLVLRAGDDSARRDVVLCPECVVLGRGA